MELSPIWFLEPSPDLEYHRYSLLAYIQKADEEFKINKIEKYLFDVRFHSKNIECFIATRTCLSHDTLNENQINILKKFTSMPDDDPSIEIINETTKWALKELQECLKRGSLVWKKIESDLNIFFVGNDNIYDQGFVMVRYAGSPIFEIYNMKYDPTSKRIEFSVIEYLEANDYSDVKKKVLKKFKKNDALFLGVESQKAYDTIEGVFPVLRHVLLQKIFNKGIIGLLKADL